MAAQQGFQYEKMPHHS